ncbi:MAG: AMP-binding protein [Actinobacteria bacterium]|nr:AMP-binding protein [Actinomycetota bacterium]
MTSSKNSATDPAARGSPRTRDLQGERLRTLLCDIVPQNRFYTAKLAQAGVDPETIRSAADVIRLPRMTKAELVADQDRHPPYGQVLTYPLARYSRLHQTSGTVGRPLRWLDTPESWNRLLDCWEQMFQIVGLKPEDRLFFPFSFGPFLGFWTAFDAAGRRGNLCLPGGGMSSTARLRFLLDHEATVVFCTPTYALRLAEVAEQERIDLAGSSVRMVIVAGEPGGSIPATRQRIEAAWGAHVIDHNGLTEVGPVGIECPENPAGIHLLEADYLAEVLDPDSGQPVEAGQVGELVLTGLVRWGSPVLRYRTGDLVRPAEGPCPCGRDLLRLEGGILGRTDDMIHLRGNNFYPSALEAVIHRFPEVAEYRVEVDQTGPLAALHVEVEAAIETGAGLAERVGRAIRDELMFRAEVRTVPPGTLPRFDMKARRVVTRKSTSET